MALRRSAARLVLWALPRLLSLSQAYRIYEKYLESQVRRGAVPRHVAIIMDGNRRWARQKGLPPWLGHDEGARTAERVLDWCRELGIRVATLYALSTENLNRPPEELSQLLSLLQRRLKLLLEDRRVYEHRIRVKVIGDLELLPAHIRALAGELERRTASHNSYYLNLAIAYGARRELVEAFRRLVEEVLRGRMRPEDITEEAIGKFLYTSSLPFPEPDLILRTAGEYRLSNFLLWQGAYSELVFMDVPWPSLRRIDFLRAIRIYQERHRRFGR